MGKRKEPSCADPRKFKTYFCVNIYEKCGSEQASSLYSHVIELETSLDESGNMILEGTASYHTHPAYILSIDQHPYFVATSINCRNADEQFEGSVFWRRYSSQEDLKKAMDAAEPGKAIVITGDMSKVPNSPNINAQLTLKHEKAKGHHVHHVRVVFPLAYYFQFYDRLNC